MKPASKTLGWKAGSADLRLLQVCGFQRFTAGKAADFDPSPGGFGPQGEKHEVCATRFEQLREAVGTMNLA